MFGQDYILYKDVAVFSETRNGAAAGAVAIINPGLFQVTPVKNLFLIEVFVNVYAYEIASNLTVDDVVYNDGWVFPAGSPGFDSSGGRVVVLNSRCGDMTRLPLMRNISAGIAFDLVTASARLTTLNPPAGNWVAQVNINLYYILTN